MNTTPENPPEDPTVSVARAAHILRVGRRTVNRLIRDGKLRLLCGWPGRRRRLPYDSRVLVTSIREALELPPGAPLPGDRELGEPGRVTGAARSNSCRAAEAS